MANSRQFSFENPIQLVRASEIGGRIDSVESFHSNSHFQLEDVLSEAAKLKVIKQERNRSWLNDFLIAWRSCCGIISKVDSFPNLKRCVMVLVVFPIGMLTKLFTLLDSMCYVYFGIRSGIQFISMRDDLYNHHNTKPSGQEVNHDNFIEYIFFLSKKYAFVIANFVSFVIALADKHRKVRYKIDERLFHMSVNQVSYAIILAAALTIFSYLNYQMSLVVRKDISNLLEVITGEVIPVIDNHFTFRRSLNDIVADLKKYGYIVLCCEKNMDIWLVSKDLSHLRKEDMLELIRESYFYDNRIIRKMKIRTNGLLECPAYNKNNYVLEDTILRVSTWSLGVGWYSLDPLRMRFDIAMQDIRIYDMASIVVLSMFYFTSLDLDGHFWWVFFGLLGVMVLMAIRRFRTYELISIAEFTRQNEFWRVLQYEVRAGIPQEKTPLQVLMKSPPYLLFTNITAFKLFREMFTHLYFSKTKLYAAQSLQGLTGMQLIELFSDVSLATGLRVIIMFRGEIICKVGGAATAANTANIIKTLRIDWSTYEHPFVINLDELGYIDLVEKHDDKESDDMLCNLHLLYQDVLYNKTRTGNEVKLSTVTNIQELATVAQDAQAEETALEITREESRGSLTTRQSMSNMGAPAGIRDSIQTQRNSMIVSANEAAGAGQELNTPYLATPGILYNSQYSSAPISATAGDDMVSRASNASAQEARQSSSTRDESRSSLSSRPSISLSSRPGFQSVNVRPLVPKAASTTLSSAVPQTAQQLQRGVEGVVQGERDGRSSLFGSARQNSVAGAGSSLETKEPMQRNTHSIGLAGPLPPSSPAFQNDIESGMNEQQSRSLSISSLQSTSNIPIVGVSVVRESNQRNSMNTMIRRADEPQETTSSDNIAHNQNNHHQPRAPPASQASTAVDRGSAASERSSAYSTAVVDWE